MPDTTTLRSLLTRVEAAKADDDLSDLDRDLYEALADLPVETFGTLAPGARQPVLRDQIPPEKPLTSWYIAGDLPARLGLPIELGEAMRREQAATPGLAAVAALLRHLTAERQHERQRKETASSAVLAPGRESPDGRDSHGRGLDEASVRVAVASSPHVARERQRLDEARAALEVFERSGTAERLAGFMSGRRRVEQDALTRTVEVGEAAVARTEKRAEAEYRHQVTEQLRRDRTAIPQLGETPKDEQRFLNAVRERLGSEAMRKLKTGQLIDHPEIPRQTLVAIGRGLREVSAREDQRRAERQTERPKQEQGLSRIEGHGHSR